MIERSHRLAVPAAAGGFMAMAAAGLLLPEPAAAHGLVGRSDLPLPDWLLAWGAAVLLIGSFAALVLLWRQPQLEGDSWQPLPAGLSRALINPAGELICGLIGAGLLVLTVWAASAGTEAPDRNFSVTFVFVTFWLGMVVLSVLFGDVFRAFNPWRAIGRAASAGFRLIAGRRAPAPLTYPECLGVWPAAAGLVGFLWFELVWGQSIGASAGVVPADVAVAVLIYSLLTFAAMALFGVEEWTRKGEAFSVYFGMFASMAPLELREGRLGRRRFLSGMTSWAAPAGSLAVVLVAIGGTSFDGAQEGLLTDAISTVFESLLDAGVSVLGALRLTGTLFFAASLAAVAAIFWSGIEGMRIAGTARRARELGRIFAHAFIPIALAYLVAHYFSLFVFQGQAQFTYLLSDPLGRGWNLLGTAGTPIDYTVIGATAIQWVQFGAIVAGHAMALVIGHDRALAVFGGSRDASTSQLWMLVVMVLFSMLGLFLLSQANA